MTETPGKPAGSARIRVETASGKQVFSPQEEWSLFHQFDYAWDGDRRFWIYSGDVGTSVWERTEQGWSILDLDAVYALTPPPSLKKLSERWEWHRQVWRETREADRARREALAATPDGGFP